MESRGKKRLFNTIMVVLILVIFASGLISVGMIQGWFGGNTESFVKSGQVKGIVNIERKGIGYTLKQDVAILSGDTVETKKGAEAELLFADRGSVILNGNTETSLVIDEEKSVQMEVVQGEVFGDTMAHTDSFEVTFGGHKAQLSEAVFSVSVQAGSQTLSVYAGDISLELADGTRERVEAGEYLAAVNEADGSMSYVIHDIQIASLSQFQITQNQNCAHTDRLCFTEDELQAVLDERAAEKQAALEASLRTENQIPVKSETEESENTSEAVSETEETSEAETNSEAENASEAETNSEAKNASEAETDSEAEGNSEVQTEIVTEYVPEYDVNICTITILCDTILENMENLEDGKEVYVPANGCILDTSRVEFEEGETVFDVLKRVCEYAGIQLEYSWTPMYNSYYIEGINNLYEFDCGNESGWMYKVNGWFPNYGCSAYELADGDNIVWCYTCNGLGADVGGAVH